MIRDLLEREQLRAAQPDAPFDIPPRDAKRLDDTPERVERGAYGRVSHLWYP